MKIKPLKEFDNIFFVDKKLATVNLVSGQKVYGEDLVKSDNIEYRIWDYTRSKPAAAIKKGLKKFPLKEGMKVLYLGVASGTTASHFSDIIGREGIIYGVDIAERVLRDLVRISEKRGNIVPILADSRKPEDYENTVLDKVDLVYCDVADPDQIKIIIRNSQKFLKSNGFAIIAIKSQSIDVVKNPNEVYKESLEELEKYFEVLDKIELNPYHKAHLFVVMKMK